MTRAEFAANRRRIVSIALREARQRLGADLVLVEESRPIADTRIAGRLACAEMQLRNAANLYPRGRLPFRGWLFVVQTWEGAIREAADFLATKTIRTN